MRMPVACVLLATAVAGSFFTPVFGLVALLPPIAAVVVPAFGVVVLCERRQALTAWRPVLVALVGLLGITETVLFPTTAGGLPTGATLAALRSGITESWQLALQSTWPARPDPELLLFVPLLVLLAGVVGVELLLLLRKPLPALVPSVAVVVVSQLYAALTGFAAVVGALGYAAVAGALLALIRREKSVVALAVPAVVLGVALAAAVGLLVPPPPPGHSLKQDQAAPLNARVASPLDEVAYRLGHPNVPVFTVRGARADRWPVVVLPEFDGVNWTPGGRYRRLGTELAPGPVVTVPVQRRDATITLREDGGRWLPSQAWPAAVTGVDPLVEESHGSLLAQGALSATTEYSLGWWEPETGVADLGGAALDPYAEGAGGGVGTPPAEVQALASRAVRGMRPSFQTALVLERFFKENYKLAVGADVPSGHGWPQLRRFLTDTKQGTSEQFAASYVALARMTGIPARLVVGYRTPAGTGGEHVVRNRDVLVWPEVAVTGVGWVPMDPYGVAGEGGVAGDGLAAAVAKAREELPPSDELRDAPVAPSARAAESAGAPIRVPWLLLLVLAAVLVVAWVVGVPLAKRVRAWRRRRRPGSGAVLGAWHEARDRMREHGVVFTAGMTPRDLAAAGFPSTADGLLALSATVDLALWSGARLHPDARQQAWDAVAAVRRGLAERGPRARIKAALDPRGLVTPGTPGSGRPPGSTWSRLIPRSGRVRWRRS
jgi:protein-glutamine gamma-glutamyltransferase